MKKLFLLFIASILLFTGTAQNVAEENPSLIILVRHAKKVDSSRDPELSEAVKQRAQILAETLISAKIEYMHSTDYIRTRNTVVPTANAYNLDVDIYNAYDLASFAQKLKNTRGRHLVVEHSNTTPKLVELLGGEPGAPIAEKDEYDRLYMLTVGINGKVNTILLRYGEKWNAK